VRVGRRIAIWRFARCAAGSRRERRREDFEEILAALRAIVETSGREAVNFVTREFEAL
jgi:predicted ArsR family transcriptional regulator